MERYYPLGSSIVDGQAYALKGEKFSNVAPGFPVIISGVLWLSRSLSLPFDTFFEIILTTMLGISAYTLFSISLSYYKAKYSFAVAATMLIYPLTVSLNMQPLSEIPFILMLYLSVLMYVRSFGEKQKIYWYSFAMGLLLAISIMIRPIAIGLPIVFIIFIVVNRTWSPLTRIKSITTLLLGVLPIVIVYSVWTCRYDECRIIPSGNAVPSLRVGLIFAVEKAGNRTAIPLPKGVRDLMSDYAVALTDVSTIDGVLTSVLRLTVKYPLESVMLAGYKILRSLYATDSGNQELMIGLIQILFLLPAAIGGYRYIRMESKYSPFMLIFGIFLYFWFITFISLSIVRYMVPAITLLFVFTPCLICNNMNRVKNTGAVT
ncbi:MAG: hypothetical protein WAV84_00980 [Bacteroidota bacterium]